MDLTCTSQTAGRTSSGNEMYDRQTVSRAPPVPNTRPFIPQTWARSALAERQTVRTGQETDPHYVWLHRPQIRSVCRPPSKSGGDMATLTSNLQSLIWNPRRPTVLQTDCLTQPGSCFSDFMRHFVSCSRVEISPNSWLKDDLPLQLLVLWSIFRH